MPEDKKPDPEVEAPQDTSQAFEPQVEPVGGKHANSKNANSENANSELASGEFLNDERAFDEGAFDESVLEEPEPSNEPTLETLEAPNPALVINVQSWATPIVGLLMLVIGLLGGYFGRPLLTGPAAPAGSAALTSPAPAATSPASEAGTTASAADRASLMEFLVSQTRHFKGNADAPVTLIEFSDFQ
ncbi:MAG: hypothetical protein P8Z00_23490 [Anaerolineales bacterium]|jgi:hypothetical protein